MILADKIPIIYHKILSEILEVKFPEEKMASCNSCILCKNEKSPYTEIKCCNYFPFMTNFMLGGILSDTNPSLANGKTAIKSLIKSKLGVTPYGILPDNKYNSYQSTILNKENLFGTKDEMNQQKCPYLKDGNCSVWKYREHLCVSFFCASVGGSHGQDFWQKVDDLLILVEQRLSKYVLFKLEWNPENIISGKISSSSFDIENKSGELSNENYKRLWGKWFGNEVEFYLKAYQLIENLDLDSFKKMIGIEFEILSKSILSTAFKFQNNVYPEKLILNSKLNKELQSDKINFSLNENSHELDLITYSFVKLFDGNNDTIYIFHKAYEVFFSINQTVDLLIEKGFLVKSN